MKKSRMVRVSDPFVGLIDDIGKDCPKKMKRTELTEELAFTMKKSGIDNDLKRLLRRRFL